MVLRRKSLNKPTTGMLAFADSKQIGAIAEAIGTDTDLVKHPEIQVAKRCIRGVTPMSIFVQVATSFTKHENR